MRMASYIMLLILINFLLPLVVFATMHSDATEVQTSLNKLVGQSIDDLDGFIQEQKNTDNQFSKLLSSAASVLQNAINLTFMAFKIIVFVLANLVLLNTVIFMAQANTSWILFLLGFVGWITITAINIFCVIKLYALITGKTD